MSLLGGNPGGMFQISAGAVGLSGSSGSQQTSAFLALMGPGATLLAVASGSVAGGGKGGGSDWPATQRPDLGSLGNLIRSHRRLNTEFEKSLFENYWWGTNRNVKLTSQQFKAVKEWVRDRKPLFMNVFPANDGFLIQKEFDFSLNPDFDFAFGKASVYYDGTGRNAIGFYDNYNFDIKWSEGLTGRNGIMGLVQSAYALRGNYAPFDIYYGRFRITK